jgi:hypothetical protein
MNDSQVFSLARIGDIIERELAEGADRDDLYKQVLEGLAVDVRKATVNKKLNMASKKIRQSTTRGSSSC